MMMTLRFSLILTTLVLGSILASDVEAFVFGKTGGGAKRTRHRHGIPSVTTTKADGVNNIDKTTELGLSSSSTENQQQIEIRSYEYDGWNLKYRYQPAAPGYENDSPLLLIHPVGIGLSSWFWTKIMSNYENNNGPAIYAPNLIGCGISEGGDPWDPDERGLSFPLGWVKGCEALMTAVRDANGNERKWKVVSQGGLAPVGVMLAYRNPNSVEILVLTSPPTWDDMTTPVPENELETNYNFLKSKILGNLAFKLLESRGAIEFFSNTFLFSDPCDAAWLDNAVYELCVEARPPVMAFNAGFCLHRSFEEELTTIDQLTLILSGIGDKRDRKEYVVKMKACQIQKLPGTNVLPWESPTDFVEAIRSL